MHEASFYSQLPDREVQCLLCPHECTLKEGKRGNCRVRINMDGRLYSEVYGKVSSLHLDPVEKKPLYHFHPGSMILSVGSFGCNLRCLFCQNYDISQSGVESFRSPEDYPPDEIIRIASNHPDNIGVSFTYNEPTVWYEYMLDIARLVKGKNLWTAAVTNGFINQAPLEHLLPFMDAFNVDLKAFTEEFYKKQTSSRLAPVKETLKRIRKAGKHLEITNLIIPGLNDDPEKFREMVRWIASETGRNTVLHLSRYFPMYRMTIRSTPASTMENLYAIGKEHLDYIYFGNIGTSERGRNTYCPRCGNCVILRNGYSTRVRDLDSGGKCSACGEKILEYY